MLLLCRSTRVQQTALKDTSESLTASSKQYFFINEHKFQHRAKEGIKYKVENILRKCKNIAIYQCCVWSQISDFFSSSKIVSSEYFFPRNCFLLIKSKLTNQHWKDMLKIQATTAFPENPSLSPKHRFQCTGGISIQK